MPALHSLLPRPVLPPLWRELRWLLPAGRATLHTGALEPADGDRPVLLTPGLSAGDGSLHALAASLQGAGHDAWGSGITCNLDCSETAIERLGTRLREIADRHGTRVAIVGHSRGGLFARVLARRHPELVSAVVTLGSPYRDQLAIHPLLWANVMLVGGMGSLGVPGLMRYGCALSDCCAPFRADLAAPVDPRIRYLSVYSRHDGVVSWRACIDPDRERLEVSASHGGMLFDPAALGAVVQALDRFAGRAVAPIPPADPARAPAPAVALRAACGTRLTPRAA